MKVPITDMSAVSPQCPPTATIPVSIPACSHVVEVMGNEEGGHLVQLGKASALRTLLHLDRTYNDGTMAWTDFLIK
jgi:hypothetical protein